MIGSKRRREREGKVVELDEVDEGTGRKKTRLMTA